MKLYRDFASVEELDKQYLPGLRITNVAEVRAKWTADNQRLAATAKTLRYGPTLDEYADIFTSANGAPVHVFLHGGYWRANAPKDFYFVVEHLVKDGICVVVPNYSLCPKVTLDEIVRQMRACLVWIRRTAHEFNADGENVTISGHSAGGHLTAMMLLTDWRGEYGIDSNFIRAGIAISGLYDLAPFPYTTLQPSLQLTWDQIARLSPIKSSRKPCAALTLAVGGDESEEFLRQMDDYAAHVNAGTITIAGANHLTALGPYNDPKSALYKVLTRAR